MYDYEHTQPGTLIRVLMGGVLSFMVVILVLVLTSEDDPLQLVWAVAIPLVFVVLLVLFHALTVRVSNNEICLAFGIGVIKKTFLVSDIQSTSAVRNSWYHGWGIRGIKGGWLFNVSGFDAVELQMTSGKLYRIGTDEPQKLLAAVESALGRSA